MKGLMMHRPLNVNSILDYAEEIHFAGEIVSAAVEGGIHRTTYGETAPRVRRLANALRRLGIGEGDRVATLAWNTWRHLELYYAIPGVGAICHTINPRLSAEQMIYITNHAEDAVMFLDLTFVPLVEGLRAQFPASMRYVIMTDREHMPENSLDALCYEELIEAESDDFAWVELDEDAACGLCYTSGTTGNPKGALYSHRSMVLHAMLTGLSLPRSMAPGNRLLPVVPLFHANAWGMAHAAPLTGASLIMPGPRLDGPSLWELMEAERVTGAWGVPTVWLGLLAEIKARGRKPEGFSEVVVGGSAAPRSMIEAFERMGVNVCHAWGMTEMSPIGTVGNLYPPFDSLPFDERIDLKTRQGRRAFGVELKIVDEDGKPLPHDGKAAGELYVRGNTIISAYYNDEEATRKAFDAEGWFGTGDVARIDEHGFLTITDRAKDLIKSGGEWISSIDVENIAMSHPGIANCAVIAVPHPKWDERPLMIAVPASDPPPSKEEVRAHLAEHLAKWQLPDDIIWVDELPLTATGKVSKLTLRQKYGQKPLATGPESRD
ncbi:MAG: fatty-acid--CoA ligase [Alphaproteobacteria bacterium]|nr:MAG: fatty-acid--CoA ligase [Alphaproteobacteria bacterium]